MTEVLPQEMAVNILDAIQQAKTVRGTVSFEYSMERSGAERWFEGRLVPTSQSQFIVVIRDATRHKLAEEKIKTQLRRMAALRAIDLAISSSLDLNLALSVVLSQVTAQLNVDAADILLINSQNLLEFKIGPRLPVGRITADAAANRRWLCGDGRHAAKNNHSAGPGTRENRFSKIAALFKRGLPGVLRAAPHRKRKSARRDGDLPPVGAPP